MAVDEWIRPDFLPPTEWSPQEEWDLITGSQAPYWEARQPMRQLGQRLQARYLLGEPQHMKLLGAGEPTFRDYVGGWIGDRALNRPGSWEADTYETLLERAQEAARATRLGAGEYMAGFESDTDPWREAAWYTGAFNPTGGLGAAQAHANQLAVATMLAQQRQRPTGDLALGGRGAYGGAMGRAIAAAMQNVQQYRQQLGDPQGSFLDWYLSQRPDATPTTSPAPTVQPAPIQDILP
jgi:hypothetical protein